MPPDIAEPEICITCSDAIPDGDGYMDINDEAICAYCAAHRHHSCHSCKGFVPREEAIRPADTSHWYPRHYCETCARNELHDCDSCEEWVHQLGDDGMNCESCQPACEGCDYSLDSCECGSQLIRYYDYTPEPVFHGEGPVYLGLELEVTTGRGSNDAAQIAYDHLADLGYLKSDSSVNGFECVTHPMSHEYTRESFPWKMLEDLESVGCNGNNAGIHVHVSRDGFSGPSHIYRWMKLIYRNPDAVRAIARRWSDDWAAFERDHRRNHKHYAKGNKSARRYSAINVQNSHTFEMRVFASSLKRVEVQAALDLVAASVEYTRDLTVPEILNGGWTWSGFMQWVDERPEYSALSAQSKELV